MIGNERTRDGGDGRVEERDGGVNEERVPREPKANDPVGRLVKATAGDDTQQLLALVENYFEPNRHEPKHQGSQEENPSFVLILRCSSHHSLLSLPLSGHAVHKGSQPLIFLGIQIFSSSPNKNYCFQVPIPANLEWVTGLSTRPVPNRIPDADCRPNSCRLLGQAAGRHTTFALKNDF
ncbi:hypothetical protein FH972_016022 [Carpinus fangiana]|uniref:Uncharacterized protein n=1 Tax=Carpinus fangiana TaxID=176857 RepID=A0A5N6RI56_9ROSI|nr:hypothetical protein FH972_016022 [Carpinus fangiana]